MTESLPLEGLEGGMMEEHPAQMLSGAHSKNIFHSKGKKRHIFYYLGWGTKSCFSPLLVCIKISSHVYSIGKLPTSMYSDYISQSEHKDVKKKKKV